MYRFWNRMKDESAGVMVENVIVLPLVFVIIIFMIVSAFLTHDRVTIETAAMRGAIYAAHCISDPNYATLSQPIYDSNSEKYVSKYTQAVGPSDEQVIADPAQNISFSSVGKNIKPYRYLFGGFSVEGAVEAEVKRLVNATRINWVPQENISATCSQVNRLIYQDVCVKVTSAYQLPGWFELFGLETEYKIEAEAKIAAVDPDEFIRNADLVVDLITKVDNATGGYIGKALDKIGSMASKLLDWISLE